MKKTTTMRVPTPRQLPSGSWCVQMRLGPERKSFTVTAATASQCLANARIIKSEYLAGLRVGEDITASEPEVITLDKAIDRFLDSRKNILSPATMRGYRGIQKQRFRSLMEKEVSEIIIDDVQNAINAEARLVSPKTIKNAWIFVQEVIEAETGTRLKVDLPRVPKHDKQFLEPDEIRVFLDAVKGDVVEIPALLALCSLRRSEILGLAWKNVDLKKRFVLVRESAVMDEGGVMVRKKLNKTDASTRDVPMIPQLYEALSRAERKGPYVVDLRVNAIYKMVNRVCRNAGLPEVGVHGLRHSFASLAYYLKMPIKLAQEIGGWGDDQVLMEVYTHLSRQERLIGQNAMMNFYGSFSAENANENANDHKK